MNPDTSISFTGTRGVVKHVAQLKNRTTFWVVSMLPYYNDKFQIGFSDASFVMTEEEAVAKALAFIRKLDDDKYIKNICDYYTAREAGE